MFAVSALVLDAPPLWGVTTLARASGPVQVVTAAHGAPHKAALRIADASFGSSQRNRGPLRVGRNSLPCCFAPALRLVLWVCGVRAG